MAAVVYLLCALAALGCTILLARAHALSRVRLLFWSAVCFGCLTLNNALLTIDLVVLPDVDLYIIRNILALAGTSFLLYGLIWDAR